MRLDTSAPLIYAVFCSVHESTVAAVFQLFPEIVNTGEATLVEEVAAVVFRNVKSAFAAVSVIRTDFNFKLPVKSPAAPLPSAKEPSPMREMPDVGVPGVPPSQGITCVSVRSPVKAAHVSVVTGVGMYAEMLDPVTWKMTLVLLAGAAGVVPLKLGAGTTAPLTSTELPPAALIKRGKRIATP